MCVWNGDEPIKWLATFYPTRLPNLTVREIPLVCYDGLELGNVR